MRNKVAITSAHHPHYIGFGLGLALGAEFDSEAEAVAFMTTHLPGMVHDVWYLKNLY